VPSLPTDQKHEVKVKAVLQIVKHDELFAPGKESLDIEYRIVGLGSKEMKVKVTGEHYPGNPIYERVLAEEEKQSGNHKLSWDGKTTCGGELAGKFLNPLYAPYKIILEGGGKKAEAPFKVLYHSIKLHQGPWTADEKDPPEADEKPWVQWKLNQLGYFGGPVGHDTESYLKKAVIRYKANHKDFHQAVYSRYNDSITAPLKAALKAGDNARVAVETAAAIEDETKESKIYVEALTYERDTAITDEFGRTKKALKEAERLNRPLLPLEVEVFLVSKAGGAAVLSPEGVGPVRISWRYKDKPEDLSGQFTAAAGSPSKTQAYLTKALKVKGGGPGGDNAPDGLGGLRKPAADTYETPFLLGNFYPPYEAQKDAGEKVVFVKAAVDKAKFPLRLGKAGVFFRPSIVAGDDYQLSAEIDFTGLPNKGDLETLHKITSVDARPHARTGTFHIARKAKVAMVIDWPARTNSEDWPDIATEFAKAHIELDTAGIVRKAITDVLTEAEYRAVVMAKTAHKTPALIKLDPASLVGVALPAQGALAANAYANALKRFTDDNYWNLINTDLHAAIVQKVRKDHPVGFIIINFLTHLPVSIQKAPPGDVTVVNPAHITWSFSIGKPDSTVFADQKDPDKVYYVVAHEMGHNFWLLHWENTGENNAKDHDKSDRNCVMSYSSSSGPAHQKPGIYTPHFCGKCNVKLRGWNIDAAGLPAKS
jgi:hypothetical protein